MEAINITVARLKIPKGLNPLFGVFTPDAIRWLNKVGYLRMAPTLKGLNLKVRQGYSILFGNT